MAKATLKQFGAPEIKIWKTITRGTPALSSKEGLIAALKAAGREVGGHAKEIMSKSAFTVSTEEMKVDLVCITPREAGFSKEPTFSEFIERVLSFGGLDRCAPEDGALIHLEYKDQPRGEWIQIAMETIPDSDGYGDVFSVVSNDDGKSWLSTDYYKPKSRLDLDCSWVFACRN